MHISLTLDWKPQLTQNLKLIQEKGDHILRRAMGSGATPKQGLHLIQTCIKPAVAYTMVAAPYNETDIARMDRAIAAITKKCCRLPTGFPNAAIHRPPQKLGWGSTPS